MYQCTLGAISQATHLRHSISALQSRHLAENPGRGMGGLDQPRLHERRIVANQFGAIDATETRTSMNNFRRC